MGNTKLRKYGHYYKKVKGYGGIPQKITVISDPDEMGEVMYIYGHMNDEEIELFDDGSYNPFCMMKCKSTKVITKLKPKEKSLVDFVDEKIQLVNKISDLGYDIPMLSWSGMEVEELEEIYIKLKK